MNTLLTYLKETQSELKEVRFPSINTTITYTLLVIGISVVVAATLSGSDLGIQKLLVSLITKK